MFSLTVGNLTKNKLVAGVAFEVNAQSEITLTSSTNQIMLASLLAQESLAMVQVLFNTSHTRDTFVPDSGIDCSPSREVTADTTSPVGAPLPPLVPFDILFTGSQISLTLFKLSEGEKSSISVEDKAMWRKFRYRHRRLEIMRNRQALFLDNVFRLSC